MDKVNFQIHEGSFLLSSNPRPGSSFNGKFEAVSSSSSSSMPFPPIMASNANNSDRFSHDINRMPETPPRNLGHRRAHSEILTLPDDICFDSELGFIGGDNGPSLSDDTEEDLLSIYLDMDKFNSSESVKPESAFSRDDVSVGLNERPRVRHQHSQSMDGFTNIKPEMLVSVSEEVSIANSKKALSAANLAELALVDPKRAKRIWANRQSAARSKERKMRYIGELERKVQTLQTDATSLSAQMTLLQRDSNGLTAENSELKLRLQTMEQQVHLQDALNEALKEEIQHMKILTGQAMSNDGSVTKFASFGSGQQFYPNNQELHTLLSAQQLQQLQIQSQKQKQHFQYHHQLQQTGDMKMKGSIPSPNQNDNLSDSSSSAGC